MLHLGDKSPDVLSWQCQLVALGAQLTVDGVFGQRTHNATLAFQASRGLPTTGEVGPEEFKRAAAGELPDRLPPVLANSIPFVEARHYNHAARNSIELIVLHSMEAAETSTTAESCAHYLATLPLDTTKKKSCHYCVDSDSVVQCVPDHMIAYAAPGANSSGLHIELAGFARQSREEWFDAYGTRMLGLCGQLIARLCKRWKIPPTIVRAPGLLQRQRGITTHALVNEAFRQSDHTDPGPGFPLEEVVRLAAIQLQALGGTV